MTEVNKKIIDAIIEKAEKVCPDSLDLIGIYGSAATGDIHNRSDLDLLILINNEKGRALSEAFVLEGHQIGYDIYTTTWEMLFEDAQCNSAHLSKLLDSKIVHLRNESVLARLDDIRNKAKKLLSSKEGKRKAFNCIQKAKIALSDCYLSDEIDEIRMNLCVALDHIFNALMIFHGKYFKLGTKRRFEELSALNLSFDIEKEVISIIKSENVSDIRVKLTSLVKKSDEIVCKGFESEKNEPAKENIVGTYEEIFSNWRGKIHEAEENNDLFSSFMNMASFQFMLKDIEENVAINPINLMKYFDPKDLHKNADAFENALKSYANEYTRAGISPKTYGNVDEFINNYLKGR